MYQSKVHFCVLSLSVLNGIGCLNVGTVLSCTHCLCGAWPIHIYVDYVTRGRILVSDARRGDTKYGLEQLYYALALCSIQL